MGHCVANPSLSQTLERRRKMVPSYSLAAQIRNLCVAILLFLPGSALAHVGLESPTGGESLAGGFSFSIDWAPLVQHNTEDWDLWYSTTSSSGPWIEIATDLPKGNTAAGSAHSYDWQVPNSDISNAWVRVRQDNGGQDYYDISSPSFNIAAAEQGDFTGNGFANSADLTLWKNGFGISSGAYFTDGDDDSDGDVDGLDFLAWQSNHSSGGGLQASFGVPEPSSLFLFSLGATMALLRRR